MFQHGPTSDHAMLGLNHVFGPVSLLPGNFARKLFPNYSKPVYLKSAPVHVVQARRGTGVSVGLAWAWVGGQRRLAWGLG